eukprot:GHVT01014315.1.p1 GENE.GHVT01014315.1~~GHVT01014315.1.p1  ORF type:complete len:163 (+),score=19.17 GHVT01014315.1:1067-1555(+)
MTLDFLVENLTGTVVVPLFFFSPVACVPLFLAFFLLFRKIPVPKMPRLPTVSSEVSKTDSQTLRLGPEDSPVSGWPDSKLLGLGPKESPVAGWPDFKPLGLGPEDSPVSGWTDSKPLGLEAKVSPVFGRTSRSAFAPPVDNRESPVGSVAAMGTVADVPNHK